MKVFFCSALPNYNFRLLLLQKKVPVLITSPTPSFQTLIELPLWDWDPNSDGSPSCRTTVLSSQLNHQPNSLPPDSGEASGVQLGYKPWWISLLYGHCLFVMAKSTGQVLASRPSRRQLLVVVLLKVFIAWNNCIHSLI